MAHRLWHACSALKQESQEGGGKETFRSLDAHANIDQITIRWCEYDILASHHQLAIAIQPPLLFKHMSMSILLVERVHRQLWYHPEPFFSIFTIPP